MDAIQSHETECKCPCCAAVADLKARIQTTNVKAELFARGLLTQEEWAPIRTKLNAWYGAIDEINSTYKYPVNYIMAKVPKA